MEKGGFRRLGRLFHQHKSESEDSEPDTSQERAFPSPCLSPALQGRREHRHSRPPPAADAPYPEDRKKRSPFGHWRLRKKSKEKQPHRTDHSAEATASRGTDSVPASPSLSQSTSFPPSEPTTPTNRYFNMPDTQYTSHTTQLPLVPSQESLFAYAIPMVQITTSTLPASFRKSKTRNPASSKEENKKKPVLGKFGNFFTTGRRRNPKNSLETSQRPTVRNVRSESPPKNLAPLASIDIDKDLSKSEESLTDQAYDQNQSSLWSTIEDTEEYLYNKDLTPLYNDIVSEWNTKGISSDSEWSTDWHSSNETIKNTVFDSSLTLQTLEAECDCITDTTNTTTPDFFKSVTNISSEDLEHSTLNHKQLVDVQNSEELEYAASQDAPVLLESKQSKHVHPSRVLTLDIFLRKTEQPSSYETETAVIDNDCNRIDIMDKKPVTKRSGKRRKSQSSSDMSNGDKNVTENIVKEEPSLDAPSSDLVSEKVNSSERKGKASQQIHSPTANHDIRAGNIHKGLTKTELEKSKQQAPTSSPYRRKSLKKNQSDAGPLSPTGLKGYGKDSNTRRPSDGATDGNPASKYPSAEKLPSSESTVDATKASSISIIGSSTLPVSEGSTESKESHLVNSSDDNVLRPTDSHENGEMETTNGKQVSSDLDSAKQRNKGFNSSRMVTTKVNLPAKPKNIELNFKASQITQDTENEQDSMDKTVKINFSIANKISMFENKHANQNQSSEFSTPKKGAISNTFVGRAKLKFGKQHPENEQSNKITTKAGNRQKALQNGTKVKESSSDIKIKSEGRIQSSNIINEEVGKLAGSQLNQNGKEEDNQANVFTPKKMDADLAKDNHLPKTTPIQLSEETETSQNSNSGMNARSRSPESGGKQRVGIDICSPRTEDKDKSLIQSDPVPGISELKCDMTPQIENKDKSMTNAVLEDGQVFEQNISELEDLNSRCDVLKAGNSDVICDSPSDMAKFTETLKNLDSSICIPQKKKKPKLPKSPAPHFAMPPIHEDHLEKIFDPNIFTVGLGIKRDRAQDLAPSLQLKLQSLEIEAKVKPKRASTENSLILQSLKSSNRGYPMLTQEKSGEESKDSTDGNIKRSRIESSPIFLSLLTPTANENVFRPSATSVNDITTSFASQVTANSSGTPPVVFDTAQKSESLSEFKAPNYMQTDDAKKEGILQMPNFVNLDLSFSSWLKSGQHEANSFVDTEVFSVNHSNKINPRPGKMVICSRPDPSKNTVEVFHDVLDCTSWILSPVILVKIIRGCWILYEKPNFEGPSIPLEEGEIELTNLWGEESSDNKDECTSPEPAVIGSIRHVVKDYRICQIDLFTEPNGLGVAHSYFDDTEETLFGSAPKTCSIRVHWGIWLLYEEPGFQGIPLLLEPGEYPDLSFWEKKEAYIRSMRPLKMGGRKVECPECPKVIIYEKPFFEGKHIELDSELRSLAEEGQQKEESTDLKNDLLTSIGSIKVKGGVWVAYEKPEFAGHQYLLEEGEYQEWTDWGGYDEQVQSLRPVLGSLMQPHMIMYTEKDFGTKGSNVNVLGIISNLKDTGYGVRTQSINVLGGIWVAYENPDFTGEQYILDKGMYPSYEAWGATGPKISSVQPLILDDIGDHLAKFKVQLFSEPKFQGSCLVLEEDISQIEETFLAKSSKVLSGSWIAYDKENFSGNQYVLEEGAYPDLSAVGCLPQTCLKSLQVVNIELSEPLIVLYEKGNFKGKKMEFTTEILNLQFLGYNPHVASVEICGGIWIIYEHNNYKGRQILLTPKKIPNWYDLSGYHKIGSLRPLLQKQVYFRLRNKETGQFMSTDGNVDDLNLLRIKVADDTKSDEQVWVYQDGFIKSRLVEDFCLTIVGNLITPGAKLGLALQQNEEKQNWIIKPDGRIFSKMKPHLILDIKGGKHYDQNHLIVNSVNEDKLTQYWEPLVI